MSAASILTSDESTPLIQKGVHRPASATDLRSACPIINSLANHGYIPRDGRNVRFAELEAAVHSLGTSKTISATLTLAVFQVHRGDALPPLTGIWAFIRNPIAFLLQRFALRDPGQKDSAGYDCLNLDQLNRHGAVEHDVSMTRRDFAQGDNHSPQVDLIKELLSSSSDGQLITTDDWIRFRRLRLEQARKENPQLVFGSKQNDLACSEAAFIQKLFGDSGRKWAVPVSYVRALFQDERLPVKEGWKRRSAWWPLGLVGLFMQARKIIKGVGPVTG